MGPAGAGVGAEFFMPSVSNETLVVPAAVGAVVPVDFMGHTVTVVVPPTGKTTILGIGMAQTLNLYYDLCYRQLLPSMGPITVMRLRAKGFPAASMTVSGPGFRKASVASYVPFSNLTLGAAYEVGFCAEAENTTGWSSQAAFTSVVNLIELRSTE
jgi:hypothetical protein